MYVCVNLWPSVNLTEVVAAGRTEGYAQGAKWDLNRETMCMWSRCMHDEGSGTTCHWARRRIGSEHIIRSTEWGGSGWQGETKARLYDAMRGTRMPHQNTGQKKQARPQERLGHSRRLEEVS
jgi:hypothetical protein